MYFEYDLSKAPRVQYEAYFTGLVFGIAPVVASSFFDIHLLFNFPFSLETIEGYLVMGLVIFAFVSMFAHLYDDEEDEVFRFGKNGFYWDNGAFIGKQMFYRPSEKIRCITFSPAGRLTLTDSLGETFTVSGLEYSGLAARQLAGCFPMAWEQDIPSILAGTGTQK